MTEGGRSGAAPLQRLVSTGEWPSTETNHTNPVFNHVIYTGNMPSVASKELRPNRRSIRLQYGDYTRPGAYFITICAYQRRCIFGRIADRGILLSAIGELIRGCWMDIPNHFAHVEALQFVVMPNHVHGILAISAVVGAQHRCARSHVVCIDKTQPGSLGSIVRSLKAIVTRRAHQELGWNGSIWQRNYFERVLRDGQELASAMRYIRENVAKWKRDRENPRIEM